MQYLRKGKVIGLWNTVITLKKKKKKRRQNSMQTEEEWFYLHHESPYDPFLQLLGKLGLATQELSPLLRQQQSREGQREPESLFRNTRVLKSSLAKVTWLGIWAKESSTHPVERAGRVSRLLWTACGKWEQNQIEEEKALSFHRPESSRYCISGLCQTCERKKDRRKEREEENQKNKCLLNLNWTEI